MLLLALRRGGRLPYHCIADATRWMRKPRTFDGPEEALMQTAQFYRRALWRDAPVDVEIWIEKDALAGVISPVTVEYDVPLMVTRGFSSETFAFNSVAARRGSDRPYVVYSLYDFDRSGQDAAASLREKLNRFSAEAGVDVQFVQLGLDLSDIEMLDLPTRPAKRATAADKRWPYDFACELDAMEPEDLRELVSGAIEVHLPRTELDRLKVIEQAERDTLMSFLEGIG